MNTNGLAEQLAAVLNTFREPLFLVSPEFSLCFANRALLDFLSIPQNSELNSLNEFWPQRPMFSANDPGTIATEFCGRQGERFAVKLESTPMGEGYRLFRLISGISRNDTLHNFHSQRLETLGMLAGGVAHDFNNVLAGILGHITYLKTILPKSGDHVDSLAAIEDGAKKASGLTQQILGFSKQEATERVSQVNLCELLRGACKLLRGAISPEYGLEYSPTNEALHVLAVEAKLAQVVVNLVINARDAISANGSIEVSIRRVIQSEELQTAFAGADLGSKNYCCVSVCDDGHGMSPEIQARIFEPYFSTKKDKGTGLGLAVVKEIVELFGGSIVILSAPGKGTKVSVYLPLVEPEDRRATSRGSASTELPHGTESVLVVDDEYPVRNVLFISLQHLGYKVETASSGDEAIEKYAQRPGGFDLVILDMIMPHMSGDEVFFELKRIDPEVQVMVVSGFSSEAAVQSILRSGGLDFLQKPFTIEELSKRVRKCLHNS